MFNYHMFIHLHWHSHYSLLEGLWEPKEIINKAAELWMNAISITDYNWMYWAIEFYEIAKKKSIKPIIWVEISVCNDINTKTNNEIFNSIVLIAKNNKWYENLLKIVSIWNLEWYNGFARIDFKNLKTHSEWIIWFTWWELSFLWNLIINNEPDKKIHELINNLKDAIWKENFYLEVVAQDHEKNKNIWKINNRILKNHKFIETEIITNNNFHYINNEDKEAYNVLWNIKKWTQFSLDQQDKRELHILSESEIINILKNNLIDDETIKNLISNNLKISESIEVNLDLWKILFPKYESPKHIKELYETNKDTIECE